MRLIDIRQIQEKLGIEDEYLLNKGDLKQFRANKVLPDKNEMYVFYERGTEADPIIDNRLFSFGAMYRDKTGSVNTEIEFNAEDWKEFA